MKYDSGCLKKTKRTLSFKVRMFSKRKILFVAFFAALTAVIILPLSNCNRRSADVYHGFLETGEFRKMERADQMLKCASCHPQEYENELKGPHSYSYKSLVEHKAFVNSSSYQCDFYTAHVNRSFENCMGCHAPQNLYETLLYDSLNRPLQLAENLLQEAHPRPLTREGDAQRVTGVDCMSCHVNGGQIVSHKHIFKPEDSIAVLQTMPMLTVNNMNCYLCHFDAVRNFNSEIAIKQTGSALCMNCHQEHDAQGEGTHYFYWQHDAEGKQNPKPALLVDDFHFEAYEKNKTGVITWINTIMPHKISPGPEIVLFCDVLDKDSAVLGSKTIRINKKKEFDKEMYPNLENNYLAGIEGDDVPLHGEAIEYQFPLQRAEDAAFFRISFMHKSQYWFPDSLGKVSLVKTYAYEKEKQVLPVQ